MRTQTRPSTRIFLGNVTVFLHLQLQSLNKQLPNPNFVCDLATEPWQPPNWPVDSSHPPCPLLISASSTICPPSVNGSPLGLILNTSPSPNPTPFRHRGCTWCLPSVSPIHRLRLHGLIPVVIQSSRDLLPSLPPWPPGSPQPFLFQELSFPKHFRILLFVLHQRPVE